MNCCAGEDVPLNVVLKEMRSKFERGEALIVAAHRQDGNGRPFFNTSEQQQITVSAFLGIFIAWETFLEDSFADFMIGSPTINGKQPKKYAEPLNIESAKNMVIGTMRYFDYTNHQNVQKMAGIYFENGYPFREGLNSIYSELDDLKTMRNAAAHRTSTTQKSLESLGLRLLGAPASGITLYELLIRSDAQGETIFAKYKAKLDAAAELIATG